MRLETVMAKRLAAADPDQAAVITRLTEERDALLQDVSGLRQECEHLREVLATTEREHEAMRGVAEQAAVKLDSSIDEIDRMIGG